MLNKGFKHNNNEPILYIKTNMQGNIIFFCIYVNDMVYIGSLQLEGFPTTMEKEFEMNNLVHMEYFLVIKFE